MEEGNMYTGTNPAFQDLSELHFDPVRNMIDFIRDCRKNGMDQSKTIDEIVDHLNYLPTEAEIIVNEFWDKAA